MNTQLLLRTAITIALSVTCLVPTSVGAQCVTERVLLGVTLGEDWDGFPTFLAPSYVYSGSQITLDVTLLLYVTRVVTNEDTLQAALDNEGYDKRGNSLWIIDPPLPITDDLFARWFNSTDYNKYTVKTAAQGGNPDAWPDPGYENFFETFYTPCASSQGLEEPQEYGGGILHLGSDGRLTVKDIHGGNGAKTTIFLERLLMGPQPQGCNDPIPTHRVVLATGWAQPGEHDDYTSTSATRIPGDEFEVSQEYYWGGGLNHTTVYFHRRTVHWVSSDVASPFGPTSEGYVDASDLAAVSALLGKEVDWGDGYTCID